MKKCLYCYNFLDKNEVDYHPACSRRFFGSGIPPLVDLEFNKIKEIALQNLANRISVTGVQPKLSLEFAKKKGKATRLTFVGLWGNYILKPPSEEYPGIPEVEDLTMHLAQELKIITAEHSLVRLKSGELAYLSKRFDRKENIKLHVEDMAQLSETLTENKYRGSMEKIGKIISIYSNYPGLDKIKLFEITLFSFITGNSDMHLKNFSLIRDMSGEILLSPAYDLLSTKLLIPEDKEDLALTLNGKKNNYKKKDFDLFADNLQIESKALNNIYKKFNNAYNLFYVWIDKSFLSDELKNKYILLLNKRKEIILDK